MNEITVKDEYEVEVISQDSGTLHALQSAEIDRQIATARAFPRSIKAFRDQALELATLDEQTAMECMYSLPRAGKKITGPSARLAEIVASCWGNCRYAARVVEEQRDFVVAQGVFHDLEKNSFVSFEVKRRITDKNNKRFNADMIAVTGNAACSIALRNAVFKGVPKALWSRIYQEAVNTAFGKGRTIAQRREAALEYFTKAGASREEIFATLEVADESEITLDDLVWLTGIRNGLQEGEFTIDTAFRQQREPAQRRTLDMATGEINDPTKQEEPLQGDFIPHEQARTKEPDPPKADKPKKEAKAKAKSPPPPPPPEPEEEEEVVAEKPPIDLDKALEDIPAWVQMFCEYYASLPKEDEDGFLDEIQYIQRQIRQEDFEQYKLMAEAINNKS